MEVYLSGKRNIYEEIVETYAKYIRTGALRAGEKLPSCRGLAMQLGINPNTVERAFSALEQRGQELRSAIENLQTICEAEEIARSKGRVHDLLGQRISLLLRALRDNQQPDETLLMDFIHNLSSMLREDRTPDPARRLAMLKETFQKMEVAVEVHGALPENMAVADSFAEIAVECVTNAVRHGYATRIQFHFFQNGLPHLPLHHIPQELWLQSDRDYFR